MSAQNGKPAKPAGLVYFEGQEKPRQYVIFSKALIRGQQEMEVLTTSSLQLQYPFIDLEQGEIRWEEGKWIYKNLSENTFTFVGGRLIPFDNECELKDNTVIRISNDRMMTAVFLEEFASNTDWQIINMDDGRHTVRIEDETDDDGDNTALALEYDNSRWWLTEIGAGDLKLNGELMQQEQTAIQFDDCLQIGDTRFVFEGSGLLYGYRTRRGGLAVHIDERSVHSAMKKVTLLKDIDLSVEPGSMVMILGGSGAGKSTFVNAVTGYEKANATITEGGVDYYKDYDKVKHRIGFVPQENLMREEDTVLMTVSNAADLRLPASMPEEEKQRRIRMVLETFGLTGREETLVSKLSGGQKKRLSICTEFVAGPSLFILDEPDSGLDGIMATELMENLRLIACQGKIVMVITHAPDRVAHLFDKVIVLAKGTENKVGQLAFYGGVKEAFSFFETQSLEGVVKRINAVNEGGEGQADKYIEKYKGYAEKRDAQRKRSFVDANREEDREEEIVDTSLRYKSRLEQIPIYLGKHMRMFITEGNWKVLPLSAIIAVLVVYVIGKRMFINMEGTSYAAFAITCVCIWNGVFNSIQVICKERGIIKREHRAGMHISSYLISHMIYQAMICLIQVVMTVAIFLIFGVKMPANSVVTGSFLVDLGITMFLITYASDLLGLMISCIVHTPMTAMTVMPFVLIVQLVFANFMIPLNDMGKKISNITVSRWGIQSICAVSNYNSQESTVLLTALNTMSDSDPDSLMNRIQRVMQIDEVNHKVGQVTADHMQNPQYAFTSPNVMRNWGILLGFTLLYALIGLLFLEAVDKDKR